MFTSTARADEPGHTVFRDIGPGGSHGFLGRLIPRRVGMPGGGRPSWLRVEPSKIVLACFVVLGLAVAMTTGLLLTRLRTQAVTEAGNAMQGLSLVLADQAERAFEAVELVQSGVIEQLRNGGVRTPEDFRQRMADYGVYNDLRTRIHGLPQIDAITAIDVDGNLVNFSRYWPIPKVNVADRDYFKALKADPALMMFIGQAVPNRGTGTWTIYIARKVTAPDGTFLGLILGAIQLTYFEQLYEGVAFGPDSAISLFRTDGKLLARYPHAGAQIGESFASHTIFRQMAAGRQPSSIVSETSLVDGQERLIAAHRLKQYPMVVTASKTMSIILADWRRQAFYLSGAAVLLELLIAAFGLLMLRQLRSQRLLGDAQAAKSAAEARLTLAQERERTGRERHVQDLRFGVAMSNMSQALCMFDADGRLVVANPRVAEMFAMPRAVFTPGTSIDEIFAMAGKESNLQPMDIDTMDWSVRRLREDGAPASYIRELVDGRALAVNFRPMEDQGWLITMEDITERRQAAAKIEHMALHDALTGLPNRTLFHDKLDEAIARGRRGDACTVLCLDLDHFKAVNDTLGHPIGDALLKAVTARLQAQIRHTDTVARLGGDEFAIVQIGGNQPTDATALAMRLIEALSVPYELDGHQVVVGTSIGIAVVPGDGDNTDAILKNADMALYRAKADGRGRYRFFEPEMDARMQARRLLELDLRKALIAGEFQVFYQPLLNLGSGDVSTFEALLRWPHPQRGMVPPAEFIPLAEEIGLIVPLGKKVLQQACADAMTWPGSMKVAVNLSPVQFASHTLVEDVSDALRVSGLPAHRLELEITETVMLADTEATLTILHQLRDLGIGIAMDDFGTGYSSLSYLRRFPFDKVKIDRSFVEGLGKGGDCDAIVHAITELCESLGMTTTAEGVETEEQLRRLRSGNCTEAQGYLFSRACPSAEVAALCQTLHRPELAA